MEDEAEVDVDDSDTDALALVGWGFASLEQPVTPITSKQAATAESALLLFFMSLLPFKSDGDTAIFRFASFRLVVSNWFFLALARRNHAVTGP